ncbi:MAG: hypothetical protein HRF52_09660 [Ignavibacterium sp.]|jgi:hypothetical protein|uniref:hypothetical protein n=1 Tax=Ignavibacterium sp. TaxID=2651167 RepID=UPI0032988A88
MENFLTEYSTLLDDSKEHLSNQALAVYLNLAENLSAKEKIFIENHLKSCSFCRENFEKIVTEDKEMDEIISADNSLISGDKLIKNPRIIKLIRYSAVAVIIIATGISIYYLFKSTDEREVAQRKKIENEIDSIKNNINQEVIKFPQISETENIEAEKQKEQFDKQLFATNIVLENFINRNIRSRLSSQILNPGIGDTVISPIKFKWQQSNKSDNNKLIIVDNKNRTIYQITISGTEITVNQKFKRGLYYWKLLSDDKLELVGKFFIR